MIQVIALVFVIWLIIWAIKFVFGGFEEHESAVSKTPEDSAKKERNTIFFWAMFLCVIGITSYLTR